MKLQIEDLLQEVPQVKGYIAEVLVAQAVNGRRAPKNGPYDVIAGQSEWTVEGDRLEVKGLTTGQVHINNWGWDYLVVVRWSSTKISSCSFIPEAIIKEASYEPIRTDGTLALQGHRRSIRGERRLLAAFAVPALTEALRQIYAS